jgi:hypothetical protein
VYEISSPFLLHCLSIVTRVNIAMRIRAQILSPLMRVKVSYEVGSESTQAWGSHAPLIVNSRHKVSSHPLPSPLLRTLPFPFDIL